MRPHGDHPLQLQSDAAFYLNEHEPGQAGQTTADPVAEQQFDDRNRAGSDADHAGERSSKMAGLRLHMIPTDSLPSGGDLLALERVPPQRRRHHHGRPDRDLAAQAHGTVMEPLLRQPRSSAERSRRLPGPQQEADRGLRIANQVNLGSLRLRFEERPNSRDEGRCCSSTGSVRLSQQN